MRTLYNAVLGLGKTCMPLVNSILNVFSAKGKFKKFVEGQNGLIKKIRSEMAPASDVIWIHAASLGEFGVVRPVIKSLKKQTGCTIVLTFFSSTGYEALKDNHPDIDHVFYLPLDSLGNVRNFLDIVNPHKAIFVISEFWLNYLSELKKREIPTYLISGNIRSNAIFFKWYGKAFKKALNAFTHFMVLNKSSVNNLKKLGFTNVTVTGDPLFDNAATVATTHWKNPVIERFATQGDLFIAGSISDKNDMELVCTLANRHKDIHFVMVPHEISDEFINEIRENLTGESILYSECTPETDFTNIQSLIVDFLGGLAYLYRYGKWAYVGGGFTPYLHSLIEATVYGLPVAFGPMIDRKATALQLIDLGIGTVVSTPQEIEKWFDCLINNDSDMKQISEKAQQYTSTNSGATTAVIKLLETR